MFKLLEIVARTVEEPPGHSTEDRAARPPLGGELALPLRRPLGEGRVLLCHRLRGFSRLRKSRKGPVPTRRSARHPARSR